MTCCRLVNCCPQPRNSHLVQEERTFPFAFRLAEVRNYFLLRERERERERDRRPPLERDLDRDENEEEDEYEEDEDRE